MTKLKVVVLAGILAALVSSPVLVGVNTPAHAVGCFGAGCEGKGPVSNQCDDDAEHVGEARVHTSVGLAVSQLKFSPACRAFWARGQSLPGGGFGPEGITVQLIKRRVSDNALQYFDWVWIKTGQYTSSGRLWDWTEMAGGTGGSKVRACVVVDDGDTDCTEWKAWF